MILWASFISFSCSSSSFWMKYTWLSKFTNDISCLAFIFFLFYWIWLSFVLLLCAASLIRWFRCWEKLYCSSFCSRPVWPNIQGIIYWSVVNTVHSYLMPYGKLVKPLGHWKCSLLNRKAEKACLLSFRLNKIHMIFMSWISVQIEYPFIKRSVHLWYSTLYKYIHSF